MDGLKTPPGALGLQVPPVGDPAIVVGSPFTHKSGTGSIRTVGGPSTVIVSEATTRHPVGSKYV